MRSDGYHRQALPEMLRMRSDDYLRIHSISISDDQDDDKHRYASVASSAVMTRMMMSITTHCRHLQLCLT